MENKQSRLFYIDVLRVVCVFLLVADHAFAPYSNVWPALEGTESIPAYWWIGRFCCSFMLPLWFFISGYLWGVQEEKKGGANTLRKLVKNKAKRLLLPCYVFGLLSVLCTGNIETLLSAKGLFTFLSGVDHLWFLPVLFWIFLMSWALNRSGINDLAQIIGLFVLSIVAWNVMALGLGGALHYLLFFQLGCFAFKHRSVVNKLTNKRGVCILLIVLFAILFLPFTKLLMAVTPESVSNLYERSTSQIMMHLASMPLELTGIAMCYVLAIKVQLGYKGASLITLLAQYSFGIYIFHHFVLTNLYYRSPIANAVGSELLPIVGICVSIAISLLLTLVFKQWRWSRQLVS